jgi:Lrp/AsnC family leucine-responsive transcriptional regulator
MAVDPQILDEINVAILELLRDDARLSVAELARRVGLSPPATRERIARLEERGVITGYRAEIDSRALGYPIAAVVRVRPSLRQLQRIPEIAAETPEVIECRRITGEDCYLIDLRLRAMDDLEGVLDRFTPYGQTTTSIVHSAPVARRLPPLRPARRLPSDA